MEKKNSIQYLSEEEVFFLPDILKMNFIKKNSRYYSYYKLSGESSSSKKADKTCLWFGKKGWRLSEYGGEEISLSHFLYTYCGIKNYTHYVESILLEKTPHNKSIASQTINEKIALLGSEIHTRRRYYIEHTWKNFSHLQKYHEQRAIYIPKEQWKEYKNIGYITFHGNDATVLRYVSLSNTNITTSYQIKEWKSKQYTLTKILPEQGICLLKGILSPTIVITEGYEDALAMESVSNYTCACLGGKNRIATIRFPKNTLVKKIIYIADNDNELSKKETKEYIKQCRLENKHIAIHAGIIENYKDINQAIQNGCTNPQSIIKKI